MVRQTDNHFENLNLRRFVMKILLFGLICTLRENDYVGDFDLIKMKFYGNLEYNCESLITKIKNYQK